MIDVCEECGKVDRTKGDGHSCFVHLQNEWEATR